MRLINRSARDKYKLNLEIPKTCKVKSGTRSARVFGSKKGNSLPHHIKSGENLIKF